MITPAEFRRMPPFARYAFVAANCAAKLDALSPETRSEIIARHNRGERHADIARDLMRSTSEINDVVSYAKRCGARVVNQREAFGYIGGAE
ncbi:MAG: hypothetical protein K2Y51_26120 [Gammaproteobacteria bacterium]|nr:hypothetical protein [Gammaproteobacteria bacterium]